MADRKLIIDALDTEIKSWGAELPDRVAVSGLFLVDCFNLLSADWTSVKDQLPPDQQQVLAVKELRNGRREICLAFCIREWKHYDMNTKQEVIGPYWVTGGNNNIIYWQTLPEIPRR